MKNALQFTRIGLIAVVFLSFMAFDALFLKNESLSYSYYLLEDKGIFQCLSYTVAVFFSLLALSLIPFLKKVKPLMVLWSLMAITYGVDILYVFINDFGFSNHDMTVAILEGGEFAGEAFSTFGPAILKAVGITSTFMLFLSLFRFCINKKEVHISQSIIYGVSFLALASTLFIQYRTDNSLDKFPPPFKVINIAATYNFVNQTYYGERDKLSIKNKQPSKYKNIIWIIDESVGGQYLSINGYAKKTTPYLDEMESGILNLGVAASCANCSGKSNILLMSGLAEKEFPDTEYKTFKKSSIFQYAQNAGYNTSYISGQKIKVKGGLLNHMTKYDLEHIDNYYQPKEGAFFSVQNHPEIDIIKNIEQAMAENDKNFMFIVKRGAHFLYENNYPADRKIFTPTLAKEEWHSKANKAKTINSYLNAINWRVDEFFKYFFSKSKILDRDDTIIIYTSDHGQSIFENNILLTHCDVNNPPVTQGIVPLILFGKNIENLNIAPSFVNQSSHFLIFPSTLKLMGYETTETTFFDKYPTAKPAFYYKGFFGERDLGKKLVNGRKWTANK